MKPLPLFSNSQVVLRNSKLVPCWCKLSRIVCLWHLLWLRTSIAKSAAKMVRLFHHSFCLNCLMYYLSNFPGAASKIKSLMKSLSDVDVKVSTARTMQEDEALHRINSLIDQLVYQVQGNERERKTICNNYIKLCSSGIILAHQVSTRYYFISIYRLLCWDERNLRNFRWQRFPFADHEMHCWWPEPSMYEADWFIGIP